MEQKLKQLEQDTLEYINTLTCNKFNIPELLDHEQYDVSDLNLYTDSPNGKVKITHFVRKFLEKAFVLFSDETYIVCAKTHLLLKNDGNVVSVEDLSINDEVITKNGIVSITEIIISDDKQDFYDIGVDGDNHLFYTKNGICHHNTGKTFNVEQELATLGLSDGDGYFKVTGSATPAVAYKLMYEHNGEILFFDDCDTMLKDQEGRNLFKNATDTGKVRKLSWQKSKGQKVEDPETGEIVEVPTTFEYTGKIIFISNLQIDKLDPDKALRTRALLIDINPTDDELLGLVRKILMTFKIPKPGTDGKDLSFEERNEVLDLVEAKKGLYNINFRAVERALGYRSALEPEGLDWATYVKRYAVIPE